MSYTRGMIEPINAFVAKIVFAYIEQLVKEDR